MFHQVSNKLTARWWKQLPFGASVVKGVIPKLRIDERERERLRVCKNMGYLAQIKELKLILVYAVVSGRLLELCDQDDLPITTRTQTHSHSKATGAKVRQLY